MKSAAVICVSLVQRRGTRIIIQCSSTNREMSTDAAQVPLYAAATHFKAAQVAPSTGGRARSPSLFTGFVQGRARQKRGSHIGRNPISAGTRALRHRSRDQGVRMGIALRADTASSVLREIETKHARIDAETISETGWCVEDRNTLRAADLGYTTLYARWTSDARQPVTPRTNTIFPGGTLSSGLRSLERRRRNTARSWCLMCR